MGESTDGFVRVEVSGDWETAVCCANVCVIWKVQRNGKFGSGGEVVSAGSVASRGTSKTGDSPASGDTATGATK